MRELGWIVSVALLALSLWGGGRRPPAEPLPAPAQGMAEVWCPAAGCRAWYTGQGELMLTSTEQGKTSMACLGALGPGERRRVRLGSRELWVWATEEGVAVAG